MSPRPSATLTLEHVLLALLDEKPMHGYELYQKLCEMKGISLIWNLKQPMLYALMAKLEKQGCLVSKPDSGETYPPRHYFHLTDAGKNSLLKWLKTPVRRARDVRQEFLAKLIISRRYGRDNLMEMIRIQEAACQTWLSDLKAAFPPLDPVHMDGWMVYSFRIHRVEGMLKWLEALKTDLDSLPEN